MHRRPVKLLRPSHALGVVTLVVLALVVLALPTAVRQPSLRPALASAGLVRAEPSYVELGFPNPVAVKSFVTSTGWVNLDFEMISHLSASSDVRWTVTATIEDEKNSDTVLKAGTFTLTPGQRVTRQVASRITCGPKRIRIAVTAVPARDSSFVATTIHFWVRGERTATTTICQLS
ncbi:MAG: hypothetical protein QM650_10275 [Microlunatus sp.]